MESVLEHFRNSQVQFSHVSPSVTLIYFMNFPTSIEPRDIWKVCARIGNVVDVCIQGNYDSLNYTHHVFDIMPTHITLKIKNFNTCSSYFLYFSHHFDTFLENILMRLCCSQLVLQFLFIC